MNRRCAPTGTFRIHSDQNVFCSLLDTEILLNKVSVCNDAWRCATQTLDQWPAPFHDIVERENTFNKDLMARPQAEEHFMPDLHGPSVVLGTSLGELFSSRVPWRTEIEGPGARQSR